jgi:hypothetical protein
MDLRLSEPANLGSILPMTPRLLLATVLWSAVLAVPRAVGADPELPPPRRMPAAEATPAVFVYPPAPVRANPYAIWNYYGVTNAGHFVPRIIDTPFGAYSPFSPVPYTWIGNHNRYYMPYVWD